ncbi:unnamed protein product [Didymodactylos carnosus]|nr:unnamed protein product [Didymodactylos carnosus]CAF4420106.1 unnamed protein product [Didymodactylos carnosus]
MNFLRTAATAYSNVVIDPNWPEYEILESNKEYEKRKYPPSFCVATQFVAKSGDEPVMSYLWKLVKYTQKGNSDDKENQINPPKPTVEDVFILNQPERIVYAKRFGGFAKEADWKRESADLMKKLHLLPINQEEILSATYDLPTKLMNRHNEVMFMALDDNDKMCNETTVSNNRTDDEQ